MQSNIPSLTLAFLWSITLGTISSKSVWKVINERMNKRIPITITVAHLVIVVSLPETNLN